MTWLLTSFIMLDTAHVFSPIALSWLHSGFRRAVLIPRRYVLSTGAVFALGMAGCAMAWPAMVTFYLICNFWHFSMQNFGILQIVHSARTRNFLLAFGLTTLGFWLAPLALSVNHWLMDIGLSSRVMRSRAPLFLTMLAVLALIGFAWTAAPWLHPEFDQTMIITGGDKLVSLLLSFRLALGLAHFNVSRLVWKLSDPQVRATIGEDLFRCRHPSR